MEYPWGTDRRFNAYADYFRKEFGERVQKLTIDAGFTCPNRDGTLSRGGCTFCDNNAFNPSYNQPSKSVKQQLDEGIAFHRKRYRKVNKYLAYFQAYSNTYAPLEKLKEIYQPALEHDEVVGIIIGTRPDCIDMTKLEYFSTLSLERYLVIEYGLESIYDDTLRKINRGHTFEQSKDAIERTAELGINVGAHMIIGLPGEDRHMWLNTAEAVSELSLHSIKFHQLQIIKGTAMAKQYRESPDMFHDFSLEEYLELMVEILERLDPGLIVERIAGEVSPGFGVRKGWGIRYDQILRRFEEMLDEKNTWQGKKWNG